MDLKYPIGTFQPTPYSDGVRQDCIGDITYLPNRLEAALHNLDEQQLHTPYRPGGWTVHQLVHHVADSHMNAYIRFKLAHTQPGVSVTPYDENLWANLADVKQLPVNISTTLLYSLHQRWAAFLNAVKDEEWLQKFVYHPEQKKELTLWHLLNLYAWHGRHHVAHITMLREINGW